MRNVFIVAAIVAGCSSSSAITGIRGPSGERLDTQVSPTQVSLGDSVDVTLTVSNPTDSTLHLIYPSQETRALFRQNGTTLYGNGPQPTPPDTIVLTPGASTTLNTVRVWLMPAVPGPKIAVPVTLGTDEIITVTTGGYLLQACAFNSTVTQPCGNSVGLTVTD